MKIIKNIICLSIIMELAFSHIMLGFHYNCQHMQAEHCVDNCHWCALLKNKMEGYLTTAPTYTISVTTQCLDLNTKTVYKTHNNLVDLKTKLSE